MKKNTGKLVVLEGPDGVGKSSIGECLREIIFRSGQKCVLLAYPGNTAGTLGNLIYKIHHNPEKFNISSLHPECLQLLHLAAHVEVIKNEILPSLNTDNVVLLDRYWWSTWVYGKVAGIHEEFLNLLISLEMFTFGRTEPDIVILLDRESSLKQDTSDENWNLLSDCYRMLHKKESDHCNIVKISNNSDMSLTIKSISICLEAADIGLEGLQLNF